MIDEKRELYAIVNNAGVGLMAPLIELEEKDLDFIFGVNVYGPYRVTKAFAPLLIRSKGRVINIGSIAGFQTRSFYGPYSMSKHALEAFTDTLAIELARFDIKVSIIDPGGFNSDIGKNIYERLKTGGLDISQSLYRDEWENNWVLAGGDLSMMKGPEDIVARVEHALFACKPATTLHGGGRCRTGGKDDEGPDSMLDPNENQVYSYDREGLIRLLDEELVTFKQ